MREGVERQQPGGMCIWSASAWLDVCPATRPPGEVSAGSNQRLLRETRWETCFGRPADRFPRSPASPTHLSAFPVSSDEFYSSDSAAEKHAPGLQN